MKNQKRLLMIAVLIVSAILFMACNNPASDVSNHKSGESNTENKAVIDKTMSYSSNYTPGLGWEAEGADIAIGYIGGASNKPDMVLMCYDAPSGPNNIRYKVLYDLDENGIPTSSTTYSYYTGVTFGDVGAGAGCALAQIDGDSMNRPDLLVMAYDEINGKNNFKYKVLFNLDSNGKSAGPTGFLVQVPGVGDLGEGAGVAVYNFNGDSRLDIIVMAYDAPSGANSFRYVVGYDLTEFGRPTTWESGYRTVPGVGDLGDGAGVAIGNIGGFSSQPDIVLMAYDDPAGANTFRYKIGWDLDWWGNARAWSEVKEIPGLCDYADGAGVAVTNYCGSSQPEMFLMAYDDPSGQNTFRYKFAKDIDSNGNGNW